MSSRTRFRVAPTRLVGTSRQGLARTRGATLDVSGGGGETFDYYIGPSGGSGNPGTVGAPWDIASLWTKASTYAGKRLGLLDGTYHGYNGTQYNATYDAAYYIPAAAAGTSSVRTVIGGVTPRGAVLVGDGGNMSGWTRAKTGLWCVADYVTLQDVSVREAGVFGCLWTATAPHLFRNEVQRVDRVSYGDGGYDNQCGIHTAVSAHNGWFAHNYVHDIVAGDATGSNESCIQLYHCQNAIVEYNEVADANCGIFLKEDCGGAIVRYNYAHGVGQPFYYGTNDSFQFEYYGNVAEDWDYDLYRRDNQNEVASTKFYNNTFIFSDVGRYGFWIRAASGNPVSFYNNLFRRVGGSSSSAGDMGAEGTGSFALCDYNLYGTDSTFFYPGYTSCTYAQYKAGIGNLEVHSVTANPTFAGGGSGPYQWKLAGGSAGEGQGSSDGTTGGSAVNIGAFRSAGQTEQIGPDWRWPA